MKRRVYKLRKTITKWVFKLRLDIFSLVFILFLVLINIILPVNILLDRSVFGLSFVIILLIYIFLLIMLFVNDNTLFWEEEEEEVEEEVVLSFSEVLPFFLDVIVYLITLIAIIPQIFIFFNFIQSLSFIDDIFRITNDIERDIWVFILFFHIMLLIFRFSIMSIKWMVLASLKEVTVNQDDDTFRGIIYWLIIISFLLITFITGLTSESIDRILEYFSGYIGLLLVLIIAIGVNIVSSIIMYYSTIKLIAFNINIGFQYGWFSLPIIRKMETKVTKISKTNWFRIIFGLMIGYLIVRLYFSSYFGTSDNNSTETVFNFMGEILLFLSFFCLIWLIFRAEDIIKAVNRLEINNERILNVNNDKLEKQVKEYILELKWYESDEIGIDKWTWKMDTIFKIQKLIESIDGFLICSFPIMVIGISLYAFGTLWQNQTDILLYLVFISSIYALLITLIYQGGRQMMIRRIKRLLKFTPHDDSEKLAKNLDFHLDRPDFVTSALVIALPVFSFLIRFLPLFLGSS